MGKFHQAATQVNNDGDVLLLADGRVAIVNGVGAGADAVAVGDPETLRTMASSSSSPPRPRSSAWARRSTGTRWPWRPCTNPGGANAAYYIGVAVPPGVAGNGISNTTVAKPSAPPACGWTSTSSALGGSVVGTVAAAGTNQATAAALPLDGGFVLVTGGNNSAGVVLQPGVSVKIKNGSSSGTPSLFVYRRRCAQINGLGANTALNISTNQAACEASRTTRCSSTRPAGAQLKAKSAVSGGR